MTPLDRFFLEYPQLKNVVFLLDEYLGILVVVPLICFILFIFYWTFVLAPRKAERILKSLAGHGYTPCPLNDSKLAGALERLTPVIHHGYELATVKETSPWSAVIAYGRRAGKSRKYFAHIRRTVSRNPPDGSFTIGPEFSIAFFECGPLPFTRDMLVAGDRYSLDPGYGLLKVDPEHLGPIASLYTFYTSDGTLAPLAPELRKALMECAPLLSISAQQNHMNDPFLFHARLKFAPEGWGLISTEHVHRQDKMDALVKAVDRISKSLRYV